HELEARRAEAGDLRGHVGDLEADVVDPLPSLVEELGDRRGRARGLEELEAALPDLEEADLHVLGRDLLAAAGLRPEEELEALRRGFEVTHGDSEVVDLAGAHGTLRGSRGSWASSLARAGPRSPGGCGNRGAPGRRAP